MGRPSHEPTLASRRQVEAMSGYGIPEADIAGVVGIDAKTLRRHYREELDHGHTKANAKVAENLFRKATSDGREAVIAAIFWLKTRAGWKETQAHEVAVTDVTRLSDEQLNAQIAVLNHKLGSVLHLAPNEPSPPAIENRRDGHGPPSA